MVRIDAIDERLLAALRENARTPVADLARRVSRSRPAVQARLERLEREGVIAGYAVRLGSEHTQAAVRAHVMIKLAPKEARSVQTALRAMPQVISLHSVSGDFDMIAIAGAATVAQLDAAIDQIGDLAGVERTTSSIVLSTKFDR